MKRRVKCFPWLAAMLGAALWLAPVSPAFAQEDDDCLVCHSEEGDEDAPQLDPASHVRSTHATTGCVGCHSQGEDEDFEHTEPDIDMDPVACDDCHDDVQAVYDKSVHGRARADGGENGHDAATCTDCHDFHGVLPATDPDSPVYPLNLPTTCGRCHDDEALAARHNIPVPDAYKKYVESVHGQGLLRAGLLVSATCNDCHGTHDILPHTESKSRIHVSRVVATCGACHVGVKKEFLESVHGRPVGPDGPADRERPVCTSCHATHSIGRAHDPRFRLDLVKECGTCHAELMETYQETYHGKATALGDSSVAKCSDCHGHHGIKAVEDPGSPVNAEHKLETCRTCHTRAPQNFAGFWAHADHKDGERYPLLHFVWLAMTLLLVGVFSFFGLHTALWAVRGGIESLGRRRRGEVPVHAAGLAGAAGARPLRRFDKYHRVTHVFVIVSFLGLALTGAPLKYSHTDWAKAIFSVLGGVQTAGWLHRVFAVVTFGYFAAHVWFLVSNFWRKRGQGMLRMLLGPDSMVPGWTDVTDLLAHLRWFLGLGPKPTWDRWTYWEKFDYWAVFWGVAIIGGSGLVMWFPESFTRVLPGWTVNLALVIHSDEALLAIGFIFAVHLFNTHLRPGKFPLDPVIFTGSIPESEMVEERGRLLERLRREGRLEELRTDPPDPASLRLARFMGILAWCAGLILLGLILYGYLGG